MAFVVKYLQDIPNNCSECPCSVHITPTEVYCNARQKHFTVTKRRPAECSMMECNEIKTEAKDSNDKTCKNCLFNYGKTFYYDRIICGYVKNKESIYKQENETCDKWVRKGEINAKLD